FRARGLEPELEVIDDRDQLFEERAVGVFDRLVLLAGGAFFVILEVGLAAQSEIAKTIEIRLQIVVFVFLRGNLLRFGLWLGRAALVPRFSDRNFSHVLRIAIKVMSSFCGCDPTKVRSSSMIRAIRAGAPSGALACMHWIMRSKPNSSPFASRASVTPSV